MADLVKARWTPGYSVVTADGTILEPGDVHLIGKAEAEQSDHWQAVTSTPAAKSKDEAN